MEDRNKVAQINNFTAVTGWVGLWLSLGIAVAMFVRGVHLILDPFESILTMTATTGWGGLAYACWIRSGRITDTALAFVLSVGVCGMVISYLALGFPGDPLVIVVLITVMLIGTWILSGLGIVWLVHTVRRIGAASNTDAGDATR